MFNWRYFCISYFGDNEMNDFDELIAEIRALTEDLKRENDMAEEKETKRQYDLDAILALHNQPRKGY